MIKKPQSKLTYAHFSAPSLVQQDLSAQCAFSGNNASWQCLSPNFDTLLEPNLTPVDPLAGVNSGLQNGGYIHAILSVFALIQAYKKYSTYFFEYHWPLILMWGPRLFPQVGDLPDITSSSEVRQISKSGLSGNWMFPLLDAGLLILQKTEEKINKKKKIKNQ